jgi:hypothetical protein
VENPWPTQNVDPRRVVQKARKMLLAPGTSLITPLTVTTVGRPVPPSVVSSTSTTRFVNCFAAFGAL